MRYILSIGVPFLCPQVYFQSWVLRGHLFNMDKINNRYILIQQLQTDILYILLVFKLESSHAIFHLIFCSFL